MKFEKVNSATGAAAPGFSRGSDKYAKNQWSGHSNDGRLVNVGRGPTKGNQDYNAMQGAHREPPTRALPAFNTGKEMTKPYAQNRGQGGVEAKCPPNADKINVGRGPTKGNM
jgi:hypothetical protein